MRPLCFLMSRRPFSFHVCGCDGLWLLAVLQPTAAVQTCLGCSQVRQSDLILHRPCFASCVFSSWVLSRHTIVCFVWALTDVFGGVYSCLPRNVASQPLARGSWCVNLLRQLAVARLHLLGLLGLLGPTHMHAIVRCRPLRGCFVSGMSESCVSSYHSIVCFRSPLTD
jgi:hypothetical protein